MKADAFALRLLIVIQLLSMGAMEMSGPFWPLQIQALSGGDDPRVIALLSSAVYAGPMIAAMLLTPLWGRLGDRTGHKPMILRALLALALCQGLAGVISNPWGLVGVRIAQGALAGFLAAAQAYALYWCTPTSRGRTLAHLQSVTAIGSLLGPVLGGWLMDSAGFAVLCFSATGICLACALVSAWLPADPARSRAAKHQGTSASPLPRRWLGGILLIIVLVQAAKIMPQPFYALYVAEVLTAPSWIIGATYGASALTLALSAPLWGRLFDRLQPAQTLKVIERVTWLCAATLAATALVGQWPAFMATRLVWGVWQGALLPVAYMLIATTVSHQQQGFAMGLGNSAAKAGALLGTVVGGVAMATVGLHHAFWFVASAYLCAALFIGLVRRHHGASASFVSANPTHNA